MPPAWSDAEHPLLGASIEDPRGEGLTLTGRLSLATHPWLADHAVTDTVLLPGTAFLELALRAGEQAGTETVEELTLQAPLILPETGAVQIQVSVSGQEDGKREIAIHSRPDSEEAAEWTCHAEGVLCAEVPKAPEPLDVWPPTGAEPLDVEGLYERLADFGFEYGPAFQGLSAAWRQGEQIFAEVSLPEEHSREAERFAIHPALLDAALHALLFSKEGEGAIELPFSWSGVSLNATGASELRVALKAGGEGTSLTLADQSGAPIATVGSLHTRALSPEQLQGAAQRSAGLLEIEWQEATLGEEISAADFEELSKDEEAEVPAVVLWRVGNAEDGEEATLCALEVVKGWLAEERFADSRLALLTEGAIATTPEESPELSTAPIWGLVRSAQSEHPGRFTLIDSDGSKASLDALPAALGTPEPQIALREGVGMVARAARLPLSLAEEERPLPLDPEKTTLITGGTGGLGALTARHLAERHGARHLLLVSRSGEEAKGAKELAAELTQLGAKPTIAACDVSDRGELEKLLAQIPASHPLGAVFHAAGVLADGLLEQMGPGQIERVFAPKAKAAQNLHELSEDTEISAFVMFSSAAGALGAPGQANYAAANAYLDALAHHRSAKGLPATSIAWGLWQRESSMTAELGEADLARMKRSGVEALTDEQGLALLDQALLAGRPNALAISLNPAGLRSQAQAGLLPALLSGLVRASTRRKAATGSLATKLATMPEAEHEAYVLDLVRSEVATVLGHGSAEAIEPAKAFKDLGFDSLAAVELRNRLGSVSGLRLAATSVFDYPNPTKLAAYLLTETSTNGAARQVVVRAQAADEPIAILGMSCRYPGAVSSPEELWQLLTSGSDGISEFPADRGWDLERLYDPDPENPGTSYAKEGGFLAEAGHFDAEFFGIAPREALAMDPQQRLLLEAAWEALEDAGIDPGSLRGEEAGVFAGVMHHDYGYGAAPSPELAGYRATGSAASVASGRVAYELGLEGPAITVDTACSSSLVSLHLAAQALRGGECTLALAGGVTTLATAGVFTEFSRQRGLAPDGRCKSFAEAADGVGWAEGVGVLLLERLSDAERNNHPILAVIRGSAVNQDGASNGLTAPNGPSQERVIRQALANANLSPKDIDAVEAHGTGTTLGDPIEAGALLATYGQDREEPLRLGSIKSNIGHTQAAAGVAGVIKMVAAMREGVLPKTLHVDRPSSKVEWEAGKIELLTEQTPWEPNGRPRRAGVSSFGISGTNAHVILEEAPAPSEAEPEEGGEVPRALPGPTLLPLSAKSEEALTEAASRLATHLRQNPELDPTDISYSLTTTRSAFEHRAVALGEGVEQLLDSLALLAEGSTSSSAITATAGRGKLAFLFTGQGSQRVAMGKELYEQDPVFKEAFDLLCEQLDLHLEIPLKEIVFATTKKAQKQLDDTTYAQPALFALQVALFRALQSRGLAPDLLSGHSVGEISAAHISGVLSLPDAAKLITARGRLMGELPKGGAMVAIEATEKEAQDHLKGKEKELSIAAINSPTSIVISGTSEAIDEAQAHFEAQGKKTKRLSVSHAFHSPLIEPMLEAFEQVVRSLDLKAPQIPIVSELSGEILTPSEATDPAYWVTHARKPVRFAEAITTLEAQGTSAYLELGPDPVLCAMAEQTLGEEGQGALIATLREGRGEADALALCLASAHANGAQVNWESLFKGTGAKRVPLPTYPFQRKRYWLSASTNVGDPASIGQSDAEHPLLGAAVELAGEEGEALLLTGRLSLSTHPWLADHAVTDTVLLPGTGFLELALRAGEQAGAETIEELTLQAPLVLPPSGAVQIQVSVSGPGEEGKREISIHSRPESHGEDDFAGATEWTCHAQGVLCAETPKAPEPLDTWSPPEAEPLEVDSFYERLADFGFEYGPAFQGVTAAWRRGREVFAEVSLPEEQAGEAQRFGLHPALFDSTGHAGIDVMLSAAEAGEESAMLALPFSWRGVSILTPGASSLRVRMSLDQSGSGIAAFDETGAPVLAVESVIMRQVDPAMLKAASARRLPLHRLEWPAFEPSSANGSEPPSLAILGEAELEGIAAERHADLPALREAIGAGAPAPEVVIADARAQRGEEGDLLGATHTAAAETLALLQAWIAAEGLGETRLCLLTNGAVAAAEGEAPDLATAPLWGLFRSAQSEHPDRFALIDTDDSEPSRKALAAALAAGPAEPQIALREGRTLVPRLARTQPPEEPVAAPITPERTILITGGTSGLGALLARHLTERHGAQHLLLASRSGEEAAGAVELRAELEAAGAQVTIAACDVSERPQLQELLDSIPEQHPLGAVIHSAGVLDDGVLESLDPERLERVMRPKADAAWHLHELTDGMELSAFVVFSSAAGILGGAGQANYVGANAFLDALAAHRQARGLTATSLAWGLWAQQSNALTTKLNEDEAQRIAKQILVRLGFAAMSPERGLELFDAALMRPESLLAPVLFDGAALRSQATAGRLPAVLRELVPISANRRRNTASLAELLRGLSEDERGGVVLELVRSQVAAVLGHPSGTEVEPDRAFKDLGFDSLAAVELRNRLVNATGLRLLPTMVFDYPSASAVAEHLLTEVDPEGKGHEGHSEEAAFRQALAQVPLSRLRDAGLMEPLLEVVQTDWSPAAAPESGAIDEIDSMDLDDLVQRTLEAEADEPEIEIGAEN